MKKIYLILLLTILSIPLSGMAESRTMLFKTSDGSSSSLAATALEIQFKDGNMIADNGSQSLTIPLTDLISMEFSNGSSAAAELQNAVSGNVTVVNINGVTIGSFPFATLASESLPAGLYVMKFQSGETQKLIIRK